MALRKTRFLIVIITFLCLAASCGGANGVVPVKGTDKPKDSPVAVSPTPTETKTDEPPKVPEITEAQGYPWSDGELYALAFLGYHPVDSTSNDWASADFFQTHPALGSAALGDAVFHIGDEYFYLLPRYSDATIRIEEIDTAGNTIGLLWEGEGMPIVFGANVSDLYPNTCVTIFCAAGSQKLFPRGMLSDSAVETEAVEPDDAELNDAGTDVEWPGMQGDITGDWSLILPDGVVYTLSLWKNGVANFTAGYVDSEIVWHLQGTYGIVGDDGTGDPPPGSVMFNMINTYVGYEDDEESLANFDPYSFFAAYELLVDAEGERMKLRHLYGDIFLAEDDTPPVLTRQ